MIKQYIQNLSGTRHFVHMQSGGAQYLPATADAGLLTCAVRALRHYVDARRRQYANEAENRKAIEHLHGLTDAQLRDLGITRMDITRAVRFGKENI